MIYFLSGCRIFDKMLFQQAVELDFFRRRAARFSDHDLMLLEFGIYSVSKYLDERQTHCSHNIEYSGLREVDDFRSVVYYYAGGFSSGLGVICLRVAKNLDNSGLLAIAF